VENWDDDGMGAFGDRLRREREARGVSLGEVSESTKISTGFLRALEHEEFERLPGGVFNRGFVRAYCKFLGIDEEAMVADFDAAYDQYRAEQAPPSPVEPVEEKKTLIEDYRYSLVALVPLILLITIIFLWRHHSKTTEANQAVAAASHRSGNRSSSTSNTSVDAQPKQSATNSKSAPTDNAPKTVAANPAPGTAAVQPPSAAASKAPEIAAAPKPKPISLEVHATEDAWMSVIADGKTMMEGVLPATGTRKFRAKKNLYFTTGNAGGIEVSYNGRPLPPLGTINEVKSLTFTSDGPHQ